MKQTKFIESQIISAIAAYKGGKSADDIARELGVNRATFYAWKKKYTGMETTSSGV